MQGAQYGCPEALPFTDVALKVHTKPFSFVKHYSGGRDSVNLETVRTMDGCAPAFSSTPWAHGSTGLKPHSLRGCSWAVWTSTSGKERERRLSLV